MVKHHSIAEAYNYASANNVENTAHRDVPLTLAKMAAYSKVVLQYQ